MLRYDMLNAAGILSTAGPIYSPRMLTLGWGPGGGWGGVLSLHSLHAPAWQRGRVYVSQPIIARSCVCHVLI